MLNLTLKDNVFGHSVQFNQENNIGIRGHADGNAEEQLTGIIGQNIICDALDLPLMKAEGFDGGVDIILNDKSIDIKTMGRKVYPRDYYVNNLIASQLKYDVDAYLFCSYNKIADVLTVCGWTDKENFMNKAKFYKEGENRIRSNGTSFLSKADFYEIENKDLFSVNSLQELKRVGYPSTV
tara:strand:+ start:40 stop:582 length:543 start_codon:yes stop_codon:yes gene_type:complete